MTVVMFKNNPMIRQTGVPLYYVVMSTLVAMTAAHAVANIAIRHHRSATLSCDMRNYIVRRYGPTRSSAGAYSIALLVAAQSCDKN